MRKTTVMEERIVEEMQGLPLQHQKKILDIVHQLKTGIKSYPEKHSITELRGCGKKLWEGIDAQEYVRKLRAEWQ